LQVPDLGPYEKESWPENLKKLAAMITRLDRDVGRLMALLKELKLDEQTLVFFASDNGAAYNDELFRHSGPLRGMKRDLYEGGLRSPSIARWPGRIKAGVVSEQVWAFWDFLPTLAELTRQKAPAASTAFRFCPRCSRQNHRASAALLRVPRARGFTQARASVIGRPSASGRKKPIELYDLKSDSAEAHDVAAQHSDVVKAF
jgi:arylsulfatase A-like enzyme